MKAHQVSNGGSVIVDRNAQMRMFDELPKEIRDVANESVLKPEIGQMREWVVGMSNWMTPRGIAREMRQAMRGVVRAQTLAAYGADHPSLDTPSRTV